MIFLIKKIYLFWSQAQRNFDGVISILPFFFFFKIKWENISDRILSQVLFFASLREPFFGRIFPKQNFPNKLFLFTDILKVRPHLDAATSEVFSIPLLCDISIKTPN